MIDRVLGFQAATNDEERVREEDAASRDEAPKPGRPGRDDVGSFCF